MEEREVEWHNQPGTRHCWMPQLWALPPSEVPWGPLAGRNLVSAQEVQWNNVKALIFAFTERLENIAILKQTYSIWVVFPYEGSE